MDNHYDPDLGLVLHANNDNGGVWNSSFDDWAEHITLNLKTRESGRGGGIRYEKDNGKKLFELCRERWGAQNPN